MIVRRLTWTTISHSFSYPRETIDVLAEAWDAAASNMLLVVEVLVIDVWANTVTDELTDVMATVDVDTLDDVRIVVVTAVVNELTATLKFVTARSEEAAPFS